MWAKGPHSMAPAAPCSEGGLGACFPRKFEKLKPLRRDFRNSDSFLPIKPLFFLESFTKLSFPQLTLFNIELYLGQELQLL